MPSPTIVLTALEAQKRQLDFISVKRACPKGIYIAPTPDDPCRWEGVLFVREGLYTPAILRFEVVFPAGYPERPPSIAFLTEIFHPLVKPLTTYTYTTHDTGADTVSASDDERLPPGGFSMRHGFPSWFVHQGISSEQNISSTSVQPPHIVEVLFYVRNAFKSAQLLDTIPLGAAANPGAWHAWQSFRSQSQRSSISGPTSTSRNGYSPSLSRQQPGGARKPGEWNWEGVWEDRIRRGIRASTAEQALFRTPGTSDDLINFLKMDTDTLKEVVSWTGREP